MHNFPYDDQSNLVLMRVPVYLYIDDFEIGKPIEVNGYGEHSTGNLVLEITYHNCKLSSCSLICNIFLLEYFLFMIQLPRVVQYAPNHKTNTGITFVDRKLRHAHSSLPKCVLYRCRYKHFYFLRTESDMYTLETLTQWYKNMVAIHHQNSSTIKLSRIFFKQV